MKVSPVVDTIKNYKEIIKIDFLPFKPKYWDGKIAKRYLESIINYFLNFSRIGFSVSVTTLIPSPRALFNS